MSRSKSISNLLSKKFKTFEFDGMWEKVFGNPERTGVWLIYGNEKNGKTSFALGLAEYLSKFEKVLYISGEEGTRQTFVEAIRRAGLDPNNPNLQFKEYEPLEDLNKYLGGKRSAKIVITDNLTVYKDELAYGGFRDFRDKWGEKKLLIFLSHENKKEPDGATGKLVKKLSDIIVRVVGLKCIVFGRCPGGEIHIHKESSELFHGTEFQL